MICSNLNAATVMLPPLRDRAEDTPPLIDYFFDLAFLEGLPRKSIEHAALARLMRYRWPGNLRELRNFTRRLAVLCPDEAIDERVVDELAQQACFVVAKKDPFGAKPQDLEEASRKAIARKVSRTVGAQLSDSQNACNTAGLYHRIIRDVEGPLIAAALIATRGHQIGAARLLGLSRNTLRKKRR
jgi:two-component system, NtrC family, nitrogen regulation response regulator GlnG